MRYSTVIVPLLVSVALLAPPAAGVDQGPGSTAEAFVQALSRADLPAILDLVADEATVFAPFPSAAKRIEGKENIAALFEPLFSRLRESGEGPVYMNLTPRDLEAQVLGDTAVVTFHLGLLPQEPLREEYSFSRRTLVLHREGGRWRVVHLHASSVVIPAGDAIAE